MINVLFVCSQNKLRSPTAEQVFADHPGIEVDSAGTNSNAENPLTNELVSWANIIFVMEKTHRSKLQRKYRAQLKDVRIICLDIPDDFEFMDGALVDLLRVKVTRFIPVA
ncbi:low molecular weight protein tyrosine phosphatase family protein [Aurantiacibacter gilvus]|uniref:Low molecular weight protein tyrosine phosphatase family protein n=1 Tax=Aurantiacibacter gilvus TaxID=3139141 RepID=A0ABU9ID32_9SPHN